MLEQSDQKEAAYRFIRFLGENYLDPANNLLRCTVEDIQALYPDYAKDEQYLRIWEEYLADKESWEKGYCSMSITATIEKQFNSLLTGVGTVQDVAESIWQSVYLYYNE